ncbi:MAG: TAXI family TRAP transporter solute-binding subunit [Chitinivibrionales bacterium]|nr:TAXI family TRAP transporter solute-binding subunit [Chitinivibrionales bacterium]
MKRHIAQGISALLPLALIISSCSKTEFVTIGTGGVTGVYYPAGQAICRMVNKKQAQYKLKATAESTAGSVFNINAVLNGDLDFGIAQSDRQYQAYKGLAEWEGRGPQQNLRSVFSLHPEAVTLLAAEKSGIAQITDLKAKRVNIGNPGSGQLQNSKDALAAFGITEDAVVAEYVKAVEAPGLLQDERIDAFFYTVGHPNGNIKEATSGRIKVSLVSITGPQIDSLIKALPYYAPATIPAKFYENAVNRHATQTFGVKATCVTSSDVGEDVVYAVTREIFENLADFKKLHAAFEVLTKESMLQGLTAPVHPGALRYYKEAGLDGHIKK